MGQADILRDRGHTIVFAAEISWRASSRHGDRGAWCERVWPAGGSAPQVKAAAQRRLQQAADARTARRLGFALNEGMPDAIALQAVVMGSRMPPMKRPVDWADLPPVRRREMYLLADALGLSDLPDEISAVIEACSEVDVAAAD